MKAGDVLVRRAHLKLLDDVVTHLLRGAGGERRERAIRKTPAQFAQAAILRTEFVAPLGYAVGLVDGEETESALREASRAFCTGDALRRQIRESGTPRRALGNHAVLFGLAQRTIEQRRRNAHLVELRDLVLHQRDQGRDTTAVFSG